MKIVSLIAKHLVTKCVIGSDGMNGFPVFF